MEVLTPQQKLFLQAYLDPKSDTFSNALQSGLKAGYSQEYSETITAQMPDWLSESLGDASLVAKAMANLSELLDQNEDMKVKADMTKFTLKGLKRDKFSERTEITGKDGTPIIVMPQEIIQKNDINSSAGNNS